MLRLCETLVIALLLSVAVVAQADEPKANELQGTWTLDLTKESELKGSQDQPNQVTLVFEADNWKLTVVNEGGTQDVVGGYITDERQTPKVLDVTVRGENDTTQIYAIYEINRGKLTIGWRPDGTRPADLSGSVIDGLLKVTFVRQKAD